MAFTDHGEVEVMKMLSDCNAQFCAKNDGEYLNHFEISLNIVVL